MIFVVNGMDVIFSSNPVHYDETFYIFYITIRIYFFVFSFQPPGTSCIKYRIVVRTSSNARRDRSFRDTTTKRIAIKTVANTFISETF